MLEMRDVILIGAESARGTLASTFPFACPFVSPGLKPQTNAALAEIRASTDWPGISDRVGVGVTKQLPLTPDINVNTIADLIKMATKRTSGALNSYSIKHAHSGLAGTNPVNRYLGAVCSGFNMSFSGGENPGLESILVGSWNFETMGFAAATETLSGTQPTGRRFQIRPSTFSVNSVAQAKVLSMELAGQNELSLGRPDSTNTRIYLEDGEFIISAKLVVQFVNVNWRDLVDAQTEFPASLVLATGTATETATLALTKCKAGDRPLAVAGKTYTEEITALAYQTGADPFALWTFGAGIGANVL